MGEPLAVERWQQDFLDELFTLDDDDLRYWKRCTMGLPRGNGKSTLVSGLGHYLLSPFDGENAPQVFSGAWGVQQARIVHNAARTMADISNRLRDMMDVQRDAIYCKRNRGSWRVVSKIGDMQQGTNPHGILLDEYHVHANDSLYQAFRTGMQKRLQSLLLAISTAGVVEGGPLWDQYEAAMKLDDIVKPTPYLTIAKDHTSRFLLYWYGLDPADDSTDIADPAVVRGCNPGSWLDPKRLLDENLHSGDLREADFRRYYLNQFVRSSSEGLSATAWDGCRVDGVRIPEGCEVAVGVDIGWRSDWSAVVIAGRVDGNVVIESHLFKPPDETGEELDVAATVGRAVEDALRRFRVVALGVDPFASVTMMQAWLSAGFPVVEVPQYDSRMCPASQAFFECVSKNQLQHNGDIDLRDHVLNAEMKDTQRAWRFMKPKDATKKIDGLVAMLMAVYLLQQQEPSVYEQRGITML